MRQGADKVRRAAVCEAYWRGSGGTKGEGSVDGMEVWSWGEGGEGEGGSAVIGLEVDLGREKVSDLGQDCIY